MKGANMKKVIIKMVVSNFLSEFLMFFRVLTVSLELVRSSLDYQSIRRSTSLVIKKKAMPILNSSIFHPQKKQTPLHLRYSH